MHRCRAIVTIHTTRRQRQRWWREGYAALCRRARACLASERPRQSPSGRRSCCGAALFDALMIEPSHGYAFSRMDHFLNCLAAQRTPACSSGDPAAVSVAPLHPYAPVSRILDLVSRPPRPFPSVPPDEVFGYVSEPTIEMHATMASSTYATTSFNIYFKSTSWLQALGKKKQDAALLTEPLPPSEDAPSIANTLTKDERAAALAWIEQRRSRFPSAANLAARAEAAAR